KHGTVIPRPGAVSRNCNKFHPGQIYTSTPKLPARSLGGSIIVNQHAHHLRVMHVPDDLRVYPLDGRELAGPVVAMMRPRNPGGFVRLPFRRHAPAVRGRIRLAPVAVRRWRGRLQSFPPIAGRSTPASFADSWGRPWKALAA